MGQGDIDISVYQEVINQLRAYTGKVAEKCAQMQTAASSCVATMNQDQAASKSASALGKCLAEIREASQTINTVIVGMQRELEDAQKAQSMADF